MTPRWPVRLSAWQETDTSILPAQLTHVMVQDYVQTAFAKLVADSGIQVSGMFTGASEPSDAFMGVDKGRAGQKFRAVIMQAAQHAKK